MPSRLVPNDAGQDLYHFRDTPRILAECGVDVTRDEEAGQALAPAGHNLVAIGLLQVRSNYSGILVQGQVLYWAFSWAEAPPTWRSLPQTLRNGQDTLSNELSGDCAVQTARELLVSSDELV